MNWLKNSYSEYAPQGMGGREFTDDEIKKREERNARRREGHKMDRMMERDHLGNAARLGKTAFNKDDPRSRTRQILNDTRRDGEEYGGELGRNFPLMSKRMNYEERIDFPEQDRQKKHSDKITKQRNDRDSRVKTDRILANQRAQIAANYGMSRESVMDIDAGGPETHQEQQKRERTEKIKKNLRSFRKHNGVKSAPQTNAEKEKEKSWHDEVRNSHKNVKPFNPRLAPARAPIVDEEFELFAPGEEEEFDANLGGGKRKTKRKTKRKRGKKKKNFKKHYMWNTHGKRYLAKTYKQHVKGSKLGHTHKKVKRKTKRRKRKTKKKTEK